MENNVLYAALRISNVSACVEKGGGWVCACACVRVCVCVFVRVFVFVCVYVDALCERWDI